MSLYNILAQEPCAALKRERGSAAPRFLCASDPIWSSTNTLLHPETRRNAWFFGYGAQSCPSIRPPRPPPRTGGVCVQPDRHGDVAPPPVPPMFYASPAKKIPNFFACQVVTLECNSDTPRKTGEIRWQFMDTHASRLRTRSRTHRSTTKHAKSKASRSHTIWN